MKQQVLDFVSSLTKEQILFLTDSQVYAVKSDTDFLNIVKVGTDKVDGILSAQQLRLTELSSEDVQEIMTALKAIENEG